MRITLSPIIQFAEFEWRVSVFLNNNIFASIKRETETEARADADILAAALKLYLTPNTRLSNFIDMGRPAPDTEEAK